eukprot:gene676-biopygen566
MTAPHGSRCAGALRAAVALLALLCVTTLPAAYFPSPLLLANGGTCGSASVVWMRSQKLRDPKECEYVNAGMQSAFDLESNLQITVKNADTTYPSNAVTSSTMCVVGISQFIDIDDAMNPNKTCAKYDIMNLGSFTCGMMHRSWNKLGYFTQADEMIQSGLAIRYMVNVLRLKRVVLLGGEYYDKKYGSQANDLMSAYLKSAGYVLNTNYFIFDATSDAYTSFTALNAQAVMMYFAPDGFAKNLVRDTTNSGSMIMFTGFYSMANLVNAIIGNNLQYSAQRLFITFPNQMAQDTSLGYIKLFNSQYSGTINTTGPIEQLFSVAGWLIGTMVVNIYQAMDKSGLTCTNKSFQNFLLGPGAVRSWTIGTDFQLGGYSGECSITEDENSGCNCNQGGRTAWIYEVGLTSASPHVSTTKYADGNSSLAISQSSCYMKNNDLPVPILITVLESSDIGMSQITGLGTFAASVTASIGYISRTESRPAVEITVDTLTATGDSSFANSAAQDRIMDIVTGVAGQSLDLSNFMTFGVVRLTASEDFGYAAKSFHMIPTYKQTAFYALAEPIEAAAPPGEAYNYCAPTMYAVAPGQSSFLAPYIEPARSFWNCRGQQLHTDNKRTFVSGVPKSLVSSADGGQTVSRRRPRRLRDSVGVETCQAGAMCVTYPNTQSAVPTFASSAAQFLSSNPDASILVSAPDFTIIYSTVVAAFQSQPSSVQARMYTVTNLPLWTGGAAEEAKSPLLKAFHAMAGPSSYTPAHLALFVALHMLREAAAVSDDIDPASLSAGIYRQQEFDILGLPLRFSNVECPRRLRAPGMCIAMGQPTTAP